MSNRTNQLEAPLPKSSPSGSDETGLILSINGGSSSIKFSAFAADDLANRLMSGSIERIGSPVSALVAKVSGSEPPTTIPIGATSISVATERLVAYLQSCYSGRSITGIGHRIVHGGPELLEHQPITEALLTHLRRAIPIDLPHLPREIALVEAFMAAFPSVRQVACFDTVFHRDMPHVATLLPIPRRYHDQGIRRYGFHGLSYTYLMTQLAAIEPRAAAGRVILAHLGSGASMVAVRDGKPIDTTMSFTPMSGLVMGTRPGDIDPGLLAYLVRVEKLDASGLDAFVATQCGMLGISETSADTRDLLDRCETDARAADAIALFCYQAKKFIGSLMAALGGLDTLVFSGGIGEHSPVIRACICEGLTELGITLDAARNAESAAVISPDGSRVVVRVIPTDEERVIAETVGLHTR